MYVNGTIEYSKNKRALKSLIFMYFVFSDSTPEPDSSKIAYTFIENILVREAVYSDIYHPQLILEVISLYYIVNISYPKKISLSLEFFVRFLLKYYSQTYRGAKKNISNIAKVSNLIKKLIKVD